MTPKKELTKKEKYDREYFAENYSQVKLSMPKSEAEELTKFCEAFNIKKAGFIRYSIKKAMDEYLSFAKNDKETHESTKRLFFAEKKVSVIDGVNFEDHIYIYGNKHKAAAAWLTDHLKDTTQTEEILTRLDCSVKYNVIISNYPVTMEE